MDKFEEEPRQEDDVQKMRREEGIKRLSTVLKELDDALNLYQCDYTRDRFLIVIGKYYRKYKKGETPKDRTAAIIMRKFLEMGGV